MNYFLLKDLLFSTLKILVLFLLLSAHSFAQLKESIVDGIVKDDKSNERISEAAIFSDNRLLAVSDQKGYFKFSLPQGNYLLRFILLGYNELEIKLIIESDENKQLFPRLSQKTIVMDSITVTGTADYSALNVFKLQPGDLIKIPQFGEIDALRGFLTLPGITTTMDFSSQLSVRGGNVDETAIMLDGVPVYNPYHLAGVFSSFNNDILKAENLYMSNYPVKFGGSLSGVLDLTTKIGDIEQYKGNISLGLASTKISVNGPVLGGSALISLRRTYFDLLAKLFNWKFPYSFDDIFFKYSIPFNKDRFSISALYSKDLYILDQDVPPDRLTEKTTDPNWGNLLLSINYMHSFSSNSGIDVVLYSTRSYFDLEANTKTEISQYPVDICRVNNKIIDNTFKADFYSVYKNWEVNIGCEIKQLNALYGWNIDTTDLNGAYIRPLEEVFYDFAANPFHYSKSNLSHSLYFSGKTNLYNIAALTCGFRTTIDRLVQKFYFLPYINLERELFKNVAGNLSYGRHIQNLYSIKEQRNEALLSPFPVLFLSENDSEVGISDNLAAGLRFTNLFNLPFELNLDTYYNFRQNIPSSYFSTELSNRYKFEYGNSYGLDVLLKHESQQFSGSIAYSFIRSTKKNEQYTYYSQFDRTHNVKINSSIKIFEHWDFSVFGTFATGLPYTPTLEKYVGGPDIDDKHYNWREIKGRKNSARFSNYHRIDIGINGSYIWGMFLIKPYIQVLNVYDSSNPFLYKFESSLTESQMGQKKGSYLTPTVGITMEF